MSAITIIMVTIIFATTSAQLPLPATPVESENTLRKLFFGTSLNKTDETKGQIIASNPAKKIDTDLITADNLVHRPLFAYRKRYSRRQRIGERQIVSGNYPSYPNYPGYGNSRNYNVQRSYPTY